MINQFNRGERLVQAGKLQAARVSVPMAVLLSLFIGILWARHDDPFRRIEFSLKTRHGTTKAIAVLPKPSARFPVVVYVYGAGENLISVGKPLRQISELGLAAVGVQYDQTSQTIFEEQFIELQKVICRQPWAQSNAVAWVAMSLGAQRTLQFIVDHQEIRPQLLVLLSSGWNNGLEERFAESNFRNASVSTEVANHKAELRPSGNSEVSQFKEDFSTNLPAPTPFAFPVLLVHSDNDAVFPLEDAKRLVTLLETNSVSVGLRVLSSAGHDFGVDRAVVFRQTAEYCRAHLPPADYTSNLKNCRLDKFECQRFNEAMERAGGHRRELWNAVVALREPERRTMMVVIGGLEDYDLAHVDVSYLKKDVQLAWRARRSYPWCQKTPLDIFERFVAGPRFFQERIESWRPALYSLVEHEVKYCQTTQQASDKIWRLMNEKVAFNLKESGGGIEPMSILEAGKADCLGLCIVHAAMARSVGIAERVTRVLWQNSLGEHFCVEVWSAEDQQWHEIDVSAGDRAFDNNWVMRVPKTAILAPSGNRGLWDGLSVGRWSSFTNSIGLVYPSGNILIKVLDHGIPAPDRTVSVELPSVQGLVYMAMARTDINGEARLTLGRSAQYPYLFFVASPAESAANAKYPFPFRRHTFGDETWQWVQVNAGGSHEVILNLQNRRPFNPDMKPPALLKPL